MVLSLSKITSPSTILANELPRSSAASQCSTRGAHSPLATAMPPPQPCPHHSHAPSPQPCPHHSHANHHSHAPTTRCSELLGRPNIGHHHQRAVDRRVMPLDLCAQPEVIRAICCPWRHIAPQSEVIRAIFFEDSPYCGGPLDLCVLAEQVVPVRLDVLRPQPLQHELAAVVRDRLADLRDDASGGGGGGAINHKPGGGAIDGATLGAQPAGASLVRKRPLRMPSPYPTTAVGGWVGGGSTSGWLSRKLTMRSASEPSALGGTQCNPR